MLGQFLKSLVVPSPTPDVNEAERAETPRSIRGIPDAELYRPLFSPWLAEGEFGRYYAIAARKTLVSRDRCYVLFRLLLQALNIPGDVWECGVYKGGTAAMIAAILRDRATPAQALSKKFYLFDTFEGMPPTNPDVDLHSEGDFADTSLEAVANYVGTHDDLCVLRKGFVPATFGGLESSTISFAHIDVDIYQSIMDCLDFIWPRLSFGGFLVFDDYGFPSCPGARAAVDEFFAGKSCFPLCLPTGQAIVFKGVS